MAPWTLFGRGSRNASNVLAPSRPINVSSRPVVLDSGDEERVRFHYNHNRADVLGLRLLFLPVALLEAGRSKIDRGKFVP